MPDKNPGRKIPSRIIDTGLNYVQAQKGTIEGLPKSITPEGKKLDIHGSQVDGRTFVDADHKLSHSASSKREYSQKKLAEATEISKVFGEAAARRYLALD